MPIVSINARQAQEKIHQGATLIDVRSQAEYRIQHIEGSLSLPLEELQIAQLPKQESLIFACLSGMRTENYVDALANLAAEGQEVSLLESGINAWKQAQLPIVNLSSG